METKPRVALSQLSFMSWQVAMYGVVTSAATSLLLGLLAKCALFAPDTHLE